MLKARWMVALPLVAFALAACAENPVAPGGDHEEELITGLTLSAAHIHTLSEVGFTVAVVTGHADAVTDFEEIAVERRVVAEGAEWRGTQLQLEGDVYTGVYTFMTSGDYEMRVVGRRPGQTEATVLYEMPDHLSVGRAHVESGEYRIEFESFPGHVHEGNEAAMRFWILQAEKDAAGVRPPIAGLVPEIHCNELGGFAEEHHAHEMEAGVYEAMHAFQGAGEFRAEIHFDGPYGPGHAEFVFAVSHAH